MTPKLENNTLIYRKGLSQKVVPVSDLLWVYLQVESGSGNMCCGQFNYSIYRVVVHTAQKDVLKFQYENEQTARNVFEQISHAGSHIAVGFTEENKQKFLN